MRWCACRSSSTSFNFPTSATPATGGSHTAAWCIPAVARGPALPVNANVFAACRDVGRLLGKGVTAQTDEICAQLCVAEGPSCMGFGYSRSNWRCDLKSASLPDVTLGFNRQWQYFYRRPSSADCLSNPRTMVPVSAATAPGLLGLC